ncbi:MAG: SDR family oxidoreductase [Fimbriimonas sp.]|nr:SDR family oxidoreductase [Fimbriimonas sp.]
MKVLFIGGTGIISSACTPLALTKGIDLYLLNRGHSDRPTPQGVKVLNGDIRDRASAEAALKGHTWDAVVDWIAFTTDHIQNGIDLFEGKTGQFVFISSASAYQTPPSTLPITESTLLDNPHWQYSRNKIACEEMLVDAYQKRKFPYTIVRPSHTYDKTLLPFEGGYTVVERMRAGKPVVVLGDGTSIWTLTHHSDFAKGFIGLLGNSHAIGESYHITSDEWLTWDQIYDLVAAAAGVEAKKVHVPSEVIGRFVPEWEAGLLGDKANSSIFDNSKIKRAVPEFQCTVPFSIGAREIVNWHLADPARQQVDARVDGLFDRMIEWASR